VLDCSLAQALDTFHVRNNHWPEYKKNAARRDRVKIELQGLYRTSVSLMCTSV
jgi:hypothetical protein